jgi:hypothetical protein
MRLALTRSVVTASVLAASVLAALTTCVSAADQRWTSAYAQGTTEAIIRNEQSSNVNIYCPAGQADTTPGIFIAFKKVTAKAGEAVGVQFVIDGKSHSFDFNEIQFEAKDSAKRSALSALIDALTQSKSKSFAVAFPKLGMSERFSLLGAKKAMTSGKEFLDGCGE